MAAKKLPAKKMAAPSKPKATTTTTTPPKPKEKPHGFNQTLPSVVEKKKATERAAIVASDKGVLTEAAKRNQKLRKEAEQSGLSFGLINVTYRGRDGKLKNVVENRKRGTAFPKDDVIYLYNKDKPKKNK
jgi:hypothetical protein